jgi:BirA family transcriptional regulator, biotin operon repressor / biotin---[acetyl-CoA-carboxylase] ligase
MTRLLMLDWANLVPVPTSQPSRPPLVPTTLSEAAGDRWRIEVVEESASTNAALAERARDGEPAGAVLVAEHQTAGRGRLDRVWVTPARSALTFSALVDPAPVPLARWPWLPLLTGLAATEGVRRATGVAPLLKWPNDVLVEGEKLAGILVELVDRPAGATAVVGVGVNVSATRDELPVDTATSLLLVTGDEADRGALLVEVLSALADELARWRDAAGDPASGLRAAYLERCDTIGRQVRVDLPSGDPVVGRAVDVDGDGRLVVVTSTGPTSLGAGDVVHVRPEEQ